MMVDDTSTQAVTTAQHHMPNNEGVNNTVEEVACRMITGWAVQNWSDHKPTATVDASTTRCPDGDAVHCSQDDVQLVRIPVSPRQQTTLTPLDSVSCVDKVSVATLGNYSADMSQQNDKVCPKTPEAKRTKRGPPQTPRKNKRKKLLHWVPPPAVPIAIPLVAPIARRHIPFLLDNWKE
jgi:hypothetical protein